MKALVWEGPREMNMREIPDPDVEPEDVLIRVAYSGICGSELSGYLGENSLRKPPLVMGHEFSGEIEALGSEALEHNPRLAMGQRVTVNPLMYCGQCRRCHSGRQNLCNERAIVGIHRPGSYADLVTTPASTVHPLSESISLEYAALTEPLACAVRAVKLAAVTPLDTVLVLGLGPIGLLSMRAAQIFGATNIFASETDPERRAMGEHFGITVVDPRAKDLVERMTSETDGAGADVVIDAVGTVQTRTQAIEAAALGGRVVFIGLHEEDSMMPANLLVRKEIRLTGSFAYTPNDFVDALDWLEAGLVQLDPWLIKAPLADGGKWYERLLSEPGAVAKVLLTTNQ